MKKIILAVLIALMVSAAACAGDPAYIEGEVEVTNSVNVTVTEVPEDMTVIIEGKANGDYAPLEVDKTSHALITITLEHARLHDGESFYLTDVTDVGNGANVTYLIYIPAGTKTVHFERKIDFEYESSIRLWEGVTASNNGSALTVHNQNFTSSNVSGVQVFKAPTITSGGTLKYHTHLGSGRSVGGDDLSLSENILKNDTLYAITIKNEQATTGHIAVYLGWYKSDDY